MAATPPPGGGSSSKRARSVSREVATPDPHHLIASPRLFNAHADAELKKLSEARSRAANLAACLDLTSLSRETDTRESIEALCARAKQFKVAAVCVYPEFVSTAREALIGSSVKIASVANFPHGSDDLEAALKDVQAIRDGGGNEVDVVLPYESFKEGESKAEFCREFLLKVNKACQETEPRMKLKVIIESGELETLGLIQKATQLCLEIGADFVKTSTGKTKVSATLEAADCMLRTIAEWEKAPVLEGGVARKKKVGFKASGGIRTVEEAEKYLRLVESYFKKDDGGKKISSDRFRIGASGLLNDIERVMNIRADHAPPIPPPFGLDSHEAPSTY